MKNIIKKTIISAAAIALFTGCGPIVEVPTAHVGKINTKAGLQDGLIQPSTIRLNSIVAPGSIPDKLILVETSDTQVKESLTLFMPEDKLNLLIEVRGTMSISANSGNVDKIFTKVTPEPINDRVSRIDSEVVYKTYGEPIVREIVRIVISRHKIDEILSNRERIGSDLFKEVNAALKETPIVFSQFGLADLQPPKIIIEAQEAAKEKEVAISKAEAQKAIDLQAAESAYEVARKRQQTELLEAETQVLIEKKLAEGVNSAYITQRALTIWENFSTNSNKTILLMPTDAFRNPALLIGALEQINK